MKARNIVLSIIFSSIFTVSAVAQNYYVPIYTQRHLPKLQTAPVFVENRTGGYLKIKLEVSGMTYSVEVSSGNEVPDLRLPVGVAVKVKEAKALVVDDGKTKWKKARFYAYWRENPRGGSALQGWLFYVGDSLKP